MLKNTPAAKNVKQKTCTKCGETKPIRNFHTRKQKKKDGSAMYLSHCKVCKLSDSKKKQCPCCDKMISKSAKYCRGCAAVNKNTGDLIKNRETSGINPKWLVRGLVSHTGSSGHTQFTQE